MLLEQDYRFLRGLLDLGDLVTPEPAHFLFSDGFAPTHLKCHMTAMQVAVETGFPPVVGIAFIDLAGKLYPWPHMVNRHRDGMLLDGSPRPDHPLLGFIETGWRSMEHWRRIVTAYDALGTRATALSWGDPLADQLTSDYLPRLRSERDLVIGG